VIGQWMALTFPATQKKTLDNYSAWQTNNKIQITHILGLGRISHSIYTISKYIIPYTSKARKINVRGAKGY
jgi:hypothetical protein